MSDLLFWDASLGWYLRGARSRAGMSLRDLEKRAEVSDSEIHKIEAGNQQCRLSSFVRVCAALGLPGGLVLDQIVSSSFAYFTKRVFTDRDLPRILDTYSVSPSTFAERVIVDQLGSICSVAAHLVRCSNATRKARALDYPAEDLKRAFVQFAQRIDNTSEGLERISIVSGLETTPIRELEQHGLMYSAFLSDLVEQAKRTPRLRTLMDVLRKTEGGVGIWWPLPAPRSPFEKKPVAKVTADRYIDLGNMKRAGTAKSMKGLLAALNDATANRGDKARLARDLGVPAQRVNDWLNAKNIPNGPTVLRLLDWLAEQKNRGDHVDARSPHKPKKGKSANDRPNSGRRKG